MITSQAIRRGSFDSVRSLERAINRYLAHWNETAKPLKGTVIERILAASFPVLTFAALFAVRVGYGLFYEREPYTLPHFLSGLMVTLVFSIVGGLFLAFGAWPFCSNAKLSPPRPDP